jgi:hypothetical protein
VARVRLRAIRGGPVPVRVGLRNSRAALPRMQARLPRVTPCLWARRHRRASCHWACARETQRSKTAEALRGRSTPRRCSTMRRCGPASSCSSRIGRRLGCEKLEPGRNQPAGSQRTRGEGRVLRKGFGLLHIHLRQRYVRASAGRLIERCAPRRGRRPHALELTRDGFGIPRRPEPRPGRCPPVRVARRTRLSEKAPSPTTGCGVRSPKQ